MFGVFPTCQRLQRPSSFSSLDANPIHTVLCHVSWGSRMKAQDVIIRSVTEQRKASHLRSGCLSRSIRQQCAGNGSVLANWLCAAMYHDTGVELRMSIWRLRTGSGRPLTMLSYDPTSLTLGVVRMPSLPASSFADVDTEWHNAL